MRVRYKIFFFINKFFFYTKNDLVANLELHGVEASAYVKQDGINLEIAAIKNSKPLKTMQMLKAIVLVKMLK